jgi:O-antigen/teichoic acid export membrane protein
LTRLFSGIVVPIILARILTPNEFGLIAMATVFTGISLIIIDLGTGDALIQRQKDNLSLESSVFWMNIFFATVLAVLLMLSAQTISEIYDNPIVSEIVIFMAVVLIILSLNIVQVSLFKKERNFKSIAISEIVSQFIGAIVAIYLALNGFGVWALVYYTIVKAIFYSLSIWILSDWRPRFYFEYNKIRDIMNFSINLTFVKFLNYIEKNSDKFIIGYTQGASVLGIYSRSYSIFNSIIKLVNGFYNPVFYSILAANKNDKDSLKRTLLISYQGLLFVFLPISLILIYFSRELVLTVFGEQWIEMEPILSVFGLIVLFKPINKINVEIFKAVNQVGIMSKIWLIFTPIFILGFVVGNMYYGVIGVAYSYIFVSFLKFLTTMHVVRKLVDLTISEIKKTFLNLVKRGFVVTIGIVVYKDLLVHDVSNMYIGVLLISDVVFVLILYFALQRIFPIKAQLEIIKMLQRSK